MTKQELIDNAMQVLGITQEQYSKICDRWDDVDMMDVPVPFIYGDDDPHFRAWSVACLVDKHGVEELEKIVGSDVLPDFSMYTPTTPPLYRPDIHYSLQSELWFNFKRFLRLLLE